MNKFMKKGITLSLIGLLSLSAATGCGKTESKTADAPAANKGPVQIEFWYGLGGQVGDVVKAQVEEFNKSQKEVVVKAVFQQSYDVTGQKLQAAVVGGDVPDVVQLNTRVWPAFAKNGALLLLDEYIKKDSSIKIEDFKKGLMVNTALDGKQYTLPYNRSTPILYYNKDIMKEIGVDPEKPVTTWDDLVQVAKKATVQKDGKVERFGFAASMSGWYFYSLVWSNGGDILGSDMKTVVFDKPEAARGLQLWSDMVNKDKIMMPPVGGTSTSGTSAGQTLDQSFFNGKIAMIIDSTGSLGSFKTNAKFNLGTAFLPKFKENAVPTGGANLAILAKTSKERQDAAWKFVKFLTSTEQAVYFAQKTGYLPIRESAEKSPELQAYYKENPNFTVAIKQLEYAKEVPSVEKIKQIEWEINKAMEKAVIQKVPAQEALKGVADTVRGVLK
ncbi:MAG: ABC transporter substrate-binding protein [Desulfitobacteriaceae bacterium]